MKTTADTGPISEEVILMLCIFGYQYDWDYQALNRAAKQTKADSLKKG